MQLNTGRVNAESRSSLSTRYVTPYHLCCFAALFLVFLNNWAMNAFMFPLYDEYFSWTRSISSGAQGISLMALGVVATWRPQLFSIKRYTLIMMCCLLVGIVATVVGLRVGSAGVLLVGASLFAIGRGFVVVMVAFAFLHMEVRAIGIWVAVAAFASYVARSFLSLFLSAGAGEVLYYTIPFLGLVCIYRSTCLIMEQSISAEAPADIVLAQPSSFLPFGHQLFLCLLLFRIAHGYALSFGSENGVPLLASVADIPLLLIVLYAAGKKDPVNPDTLFQVSFLLVSAGYLLLPLAASGFLELVNALLVSGVGCFEILIWFVLITLGKRNPAAALPIIAWGTAMTSIGIIIGANLGGAANAVYSTDHAVLTVITAVVVFLSMMYVVVALKRFSFAETILALQPAQHVSVNENTDNLEDRCQAIAKDFSLTARELEVFSLLARGRTGKFIQDELVISYNTVKAHIKHIYTKLDVHTHQELIDIVEAYAVTPSNFDFSESREECG